jgi:hypothetical protein
MSSCKLFDWENRLTADTCAQNVRNEENKDILSYNTYNFYGDCDRKIALANECPNLHFRNGYGFTSACTVDTDSAVRFSQQTHGPEKRQVNIRPFTAVPDMSRGSCSIDTESYLLNAQDTTIIRECNRVDPGDRFTPLLDCVQDYVRGYGYLDRNIGADSREISRQYMKSCQ